WFLDKGTPENRHRRRRSRARATHPASRRRRPSRDPGPPGRADGRAPRRRRCTSAWASVPQALGLRRGASAFAVRLVLDEEIVLGEGTGFPFAKDRQGKHVSRVLLGTRADGQCIGANARADRREIGVGDAEVAEEKGA